MSRGPEEVREIVVATGNPHKVEEVRAILGPDGFKVLALEDVGGATIPEPIEDGDSFAANARIKAIAYAKALGRSVIADDSGLEVDALGGAPGIHSARWAGVGGSRAERDAANNAKLVVSMADVADGQRTARFLCAMCLCDSSGTILAETTGALEGTIARTPAGVHGFGYDPFLLVDGGSRSSAELSPEEKNARSHRGAAARAMALVIRAIDFARAQ